MADSASDLPVIYQHPLAYLLGLEGLALLRAFSGAYDRDFTLARLDEFVRIQQPAATKKANAKLTGESPPLFEPRSCGRKSGITPWPMA